MKARQVRTQPLVPAAVLLTLLLGCSRPSADPQPLAADAATPPPTTAAASASGPTTADKPPPDAGIAAPSADGHLPALEVCKRVVAAKIATACQPMPPDGAALGAAQFTAPGTAARQQPLFGAVFTYAAVAEYDKALAAFRGDKVGAKRAPPAILPNAAALTIVIADGELRAEDISSLDAIVASLP